jgi:predicted dehydrogenase
MRLRFLVIGCGSIGRRHIGNLMALDAGEILAFDARDDRRREIESQFAVQAVNSLQDAWAQNPSVALITTPTSMHVPLAIEAAQRGCHLFVEKPLSDSLDGVDDLLDNVMNRHLVTLVGCNMRFHPGVIKVKELVDTGAIGRIVSARVEVGQYLPDWHPSEDYRLGYSSSKDLGGGVILDAIHELDYIRWLLGQVDAVACFAGKLSHLEINTEDTAAVLLRFTSGVIGELHMDYVQRAYSRTCQIIGEQGTVRWDYMTGEVRWYSAITREWRVFANPPGWESNGMYVAELRHFLACLAGNDKSLVDVFEGALVLRLALAIKTSAKTTEIISCAHENIVR